MSNRVFDSLRQCAEVWIHAIGALYLALSKIWGLPYGAEICGTISAIGLCVGTIVNAKRAMYNAVDESELAKEVNEDGNEE